MIWSLLQRAARALPPEAAHGAAIEALALGLAPSFRPGDPALACDLAGLRLASPIGLAAGFDKNAAALPGLARCGFGFVEIGTVTPLAQKGNPRPRVFRLAEDGAVINRLGFNNAGSARAAERLAKRPPGLVVGVNVGANKESLTRLDAVIADYEIGLARLAPLADFATINISSPNTPGLRDLQTGEPLQRLLAACRAACQGKPLFLKIAPDLSGAQIEEIARAASAHAIDAIIAGNTTVSRPPGLKGAHAAEQGGLSGAPLLELSTRTLKAFALTIATLPGHRPQLIGVGGVSSGADALAKIKAGASAVQLYTALVYRGPVLVRQITEELAAALRAEGFASVRDAVGASL